MKVLHVISRIETSGPNKVLVALARAQTGLGASVAVASLQPARDEPAMTAGLRAHGVAVRAIAATGRIGQVRALARLARSFDVVHVHCLRSLLLAVLARSGNVVTTSHNIPDEDWPHARGRVPGWMLGHLHYALMARAGRVVAINSRMRDRIAARGGRVVLLSNPAELPETPNPPIAGAPKRILCVGHLNSRKNQELLLEALELLGPRAAGLRLDLVGDGPMRRKLEERAMNAACEVRFIGHVPDPGPWFRQADLYVSPALSEGQPIAVLEALGHGIPCLLSDISGHALRGAPEGSVRTFATDPRSLAEALGAATGAATGCRPEQIARWARDNFAPASVAARYLDLYDEFVNGGETSID